MSEQESRPGVANRIGEAAPTGGREANAPARAEAAPLDSSYISRRYHDGERLFSAPPWVRRRLLGIAFRLREDPSANEYSLTVRNGKLDLHADMLALKGAKNYAHDRGSIKAWSKGSRKRFFDYLLAVNWESLEKAKLFVTLTYPNLFPHDGAVCKAHLDAFLKAVERRFGPVAFVWKREFQARGAPHYHGVLIGDIDESLGRVKEWMREKWNRIAGQGDPAHLAMGVDVDEVRDARRLSTYLAFYMCKGNQDKVPSSWSDMRASRSYDEPFERPGRWWGVWRKELLPVMVEHFELTATQFSEGRELVRRAWDDFGLPQYPGETRVSYIEFDPAKLGAMKSAILAER